MSFIPDKIGPGSRSKRANSRNWLNEWPSKAMSPGIRSAIAGDLKVGIAWHYNCNVLKKTLSRAEGSQHFLFGNFTIVVSIC